MCSRNKNASHFGPSAGKAQPNKGKYGDKFSLISCWLIKAARWGVQIETTTPADCLEGGGPGPGVGRGVLPQGQQ